ncbi:MAG: zinc-finger domain-containing protein [Cocleimonas sp.]|nr:zinc-finger domain-containing protein [Cocleimonas sp.]
MATPLAACKKLNIKKEVTITQADLPLHCPTNHTVGWCSHPRVFLAIEMSKTKSCRCPYCGTVYRLENENSL